MSKVYWSYRYSQKYQPMIRILHALRVLCFVSDGVLIVPYSEEAKESNFRLH